MWFSGSYGGAPYEIITGPSLEFTMPEMISGKVYQADGATPAGGSIVYARIGSSKTLSCLVNNQGAWAMDIAPLRAADYQSYYAHSDGDTLTLDVLHGDTGSTSSKLKIDEGKTGASSIVMPISNTRSTGTITAVITAGGTQAGWLPWWGWLAIGFAALAVVGFILKKFVYYHD